MSESDESKYLSKVTKNKTEMEQRIKHLESIIKEKKILIQKLDREYESKSWQLFWKTYWFSGNRNRSAYTKKSDDVVIGQYSVNTKRGSIQGEEYDTVYIYNTPEVKALKDVVDKLASRLSTIYNDTVILNLCIKILQYCIRNNITELRDNLLRNQFKRFTNIDLIRENFLGDDEYPGCLITALFSFEGFDKQETYHASHGETGAIDTTSNERPHDEQLPVETEDAEKQYVESNGGKHKKTIKNKKRYHQKTYRNKNKNK
jgi:hypothetical protein